MRKIARDIRSHLTKIVRLLYSAPIGDHPTPIESGYNTPPDPQRLGQQICRTRQANTHLRHTFVASEESSRARNTYVRRQHSPRTRLQGSLVQLHRRSEDAGRIYAGYFQCRGGKSYGTYNEDCVRLAEKVC